MHTIKYRLLIVMLACSLLGTIVGCGRQKVSFVTDDADVVATSHEGDSTQDDEIGTLDGFVVASGTDASQPMIPVYVCGAVNAPGVYYLQVGSLKKDALDCAGGFAEDASREYVNLAETISEGEQIYFPTISEIDTWKPIYNMSGDSSEDGRISINSANREQLMTLPGIGESKADAIIAYREQNGPFGTTEDLLKVPGIKDGVYQKIKAYIVVD